MVCSLIVSGIFLTYATLRPRGIVAALASVPWLVAGLVASLVIRRCVALSLPPVKRKEWWVLAGGASVTIGITLVAIELPLRIPTASLALFSVSVFAFPLSRSLVGSGLAKRSAILVTAVGTVTSLILMATRAGDITATIASACVCATWFSIGAWEALRG